jgi:EAL domain-containing protein (putative c-di-GMP-specific phosphodiesterase class I)
VIAQQCDDVRHAALSGSVALVPAAIGYLSGLSHISKLRNAMERQALRSILATDFVPVGCRECREGRLLDVPFTMAFQPIVDVTNRRVFGYEALVRGPNQEGAGSVLGQINDSNRYAFDQACRVKAIDLASRLGLEGILSINFLPNAVYRAETCIRATLQAAKEVAFPLERLMFEVTEQEPVRDPDHLRGIFAEYKRQGFLTAFDDFGAGHSGLNLLAQFQPDVIKLDMALTRNIDQDRVRRAIVFGILEVCREIGIRVIAEGIESRAECMTLWDEGVDLFQGYYFARPGFESLPQIPESVWAELTPRRVSDRRSRRG